MRHAFVACCVLSVCVCQYFVTVPMSAYDQLNADNITDIIAYYLNNAPLPAHRNVSADPLMWERHHLRRSDQKNPDYYWQEPNGQQQRHQKNDVPALLATHAAHSDGAFLLCVCCV